jgi:hypothetical protein
VEGNEMKYKHLYVVTRRDLFPGYQGVQSQHAIAEFAFNYPQEFKKWRIESNYLAWLSVRNEDELKKLAIKLGRADIKIVGFFEPDTFFQLTALAIEPGAKSARLLKKLPLALKGVK